MTKSLRQKAFSLVEVTIALGIAGFCMIVLIGLLPIGVQSNQAASSQTAAASILSDVVADLRAAGTNTQSLEYGIVFGSRKDLYFDEEGGFATSNQATSRYRVVITFPTTSTYTTCANVRVSWPAVIDPTTATPAGSIEAVAAFDRH